LVSRVRSTGADLYAYLDSALKSIEPLRSQLGSAVVNKREAALLPLSGAVGPSYSDRIMLAGDAAGHCSPITGEGIYYAMLGGRIAGEAAADAVIRSDFSSTKLAAYERRWKKAMGSDLKWGLWLQRRFTRPGPGTSKAGFLRSQKSRRIVAEMLVGMRSVRGAVLSVAPGYLRSRLG
jgi:flavin-dependent dehydrogenase